MCDPETQCRCCECKGKMCFVYHPGHSHRIELSKLLKPVEKDPSESLPDPDYGF